MFSQQWGKHYQDIPTRDFCMRKLDLRGKRFGRLIVLRQSGKTKSGNYTWLCRCDCNIEKVVVSGNLTSGNSLSCGCLVKIHGQAGTRFYKIWAGIIDRCLNKKSPNWKNYGGRGITVCKRWLKFENFMVDMHESYLEHIKEHGKDTTIDRTDNNRGYSKNNCSFATMKTQQRNRRNNRLMEFQGETRCVSEWAEIFGISVSTLFNRLYRGWSVEKSLTTPVK